MSLISFGKSVSSLFLVMYLMHSKISCSWAGLAQGLSRHIPLRMPTSSFWLQLPADIRNSSIGAFKQFWFFKATTAVIKAGVTGSDVFTTTSWL